MVSKRRMVVFGLSEGESKEARRLEDVVPVFGRFGLFSLVPWLQDFCF